MAAEENDAPWLHCSEPRHRFRFVGRRGDPTGTGDPKADWLVWRSDQHEPDAENVVRHAVAIKPDAFWRKPHRVANDG